MYLFLCEGPVRRGYACIASDMGHKGATNLAGVWAGGDCRAGGLDLTVEAVEHGKRSAQAIHQQLAARAGLDNVELHHGSDRDPVWEYVRTAETATGLDRAIAAPRIAPMVGLERASRCSQRQRPSASRPWPRNPRADRATASLNSIAAARVLDEKLANWSGGRRYTCPSYEIERVSDGVKAHPVAAVQRLEVTPRSLAARHVSAPRSRRRSAGGRPRRRSP